MVTIDSGRLRSLLAAATPGEWVPRILSHETDDDEEGSCAIGPILLGYNRDRQAANDAALIVAAVNALPALLEVWELARSFVAAHDAVYNLGGPDVPESIAVDVMSNVTDALVIGFRRLSGAGGGEAPTNSSQIGSNEPTREAPGERGDEAYAAAWKVARERVLRGEARSTSAETERILTGREHDPDPAAGGRCGTCGGKGGFLPPRPAVCPSCEGSGRGSEAK